MRQGRRDADARHVVPPVRAVGAEPFRRAVLGVGPGGEVQVDRFLRRSGLPGHRGVIGGEGLDHPVLATHPVREQVMAPVVDQGLGVGQPEQAPACRPVDAWIERTRIVLRHHLLGDGAGVGPVTEIDDVGPVVQAGVVDADEPVLGVDEPELGELRVLHHRARRGDEEFGIDGPVDLDILGDVDRHIERCLLGEPQRTLGRAERELSWAVRHHDLRVGRIAHSTSRRSRRRPGRPGLTGRADRLIPPVPELS